MIGKTLGHYRIIEKLGGGGMGVVYTAEDTNLSRRVALKFLPEEVSADPQALERLKREAQTASALNHPNICTIYEVGEAEGQTYIAMERVEGKPLSSLVGREGLPVETALRYGLQIAEALAHAHEHGVIHCDLKSANVVITPDGRGKVLDFGLARRLGDKELQEVTLSQASLMAGAVVGTVPYMAPEVLRGQPADARSDLWSLGVMLYEMATGTRPFKGQTGFELSSAILKEPPAPLSARVPAGLWAVIQRCLVKEPEQRYQRASEVRAALEAIQSGAAIPAVAVSMPWRRLPGRWPLAVAGALALLLAMFLVVNVGGWRERLFGRAGPPGIDSLAVLPLENLSGDPEQEYFADGMTEALITELGKIRALKVISRTSVMRYKRTNKPLPEIARDLGVEGIVEGSVMRVGDRVRITAQLIHAPSDAHLWAENYERDLSDVLRLQNEIARSIASEIRITLTPTEQAHLAGARSVKPEAHEAYLRGRYHWNQRTERDVKKAIEHFAEAIAKDPSYALGYEGLAEAYVVLPYYSAVSVKQAYPKGEAAARKALEMDGSLAGAHASLGMVKELYEYDWSGADTAYQRALAANPGYASAHQFYARYLSVVGRHAEALAEIERAQELDPLSLVIQLNMSIILSEAQQYDQAIEKAQHVIEMRPDYAAAYDHLADVYEEKGMYKQMIEAAGMATNLSGRNPGYAARLGRAYALADQREEALRILEELGQRGKQEYVRATRMAGLYLALGDKRRALEWLERGYEERDIGMVAMKVMHTPDPLRDDPRYRNLLRRMNFPE